MIYLAQCIPGLQAIAWTHLSNEPFIHKLHLQEDGLLVFEASVHQRRFRNVHYLNNVFLVLDHLSDTANAAAALEEFGHRTNWHRKIQSSVTPKERSFRIMVQDEGQLVKADRVALGRINATLKRLTHLTPTPRGGGVEFWIMRRQSGRAFLCKRLSRRVRTESKLIKGELRPELAHLLCLLSEPHKKDIVLDPFAGTGAIPFARTFYPYNMIFAFDSNPEQVRLVKSRVKAGEDLRVRKSSPLIAGEEDARHLSRLDDGFIHKIVTDPPWGAYQPSLADHLPTLYREALSELCRVLQHGGLLVMLLGDADLAESLSQDFESCLKPLDAYRILVSGKKAAVYKWRRR